MTGEERRKSIIEYIKSCDKPVSGAKLALMYGVSRQVVVQDMALLRASGCGIMSTARGYIANDDSQITRVIHVKHSDEEIEAELNAIVDMGGKVIDVFIEHNIYGHIRAELMLSSRRDVKVFMNGIATGESKPLKNLTDGTHYHTISAKSEADLDVIEEELRKMNYLLEK